jgi:hypothetical protein
MPAPPGNHDAFAIISTLAKAAKRDEDRRASALKFSAAPYKKPVKMTTGSHRPSRLRN